MTDNQRDWRWWQHLLLWSLTILSLIGLSTTLSYFHRRHGELRGKIEQGSWYEMRTRSGNGIYLEPVIDPGNAFYPTLSDEGIIAALDDRPNITRKRRGFGASWEQLGFGKNPSIVESGPWVLFSTEEQAMLYLRVTGVPEANIRYLYK